MSFSTKAGSEGSEADLQVRHLGPLLVHFCDYGILVCKQCRYAIQPNAVNQHLLRHRIYRDKRQQLLRDIEGLTLLLPENVPVPTQVGPAFPYISTSEGFRCRVGNCAHMCTASKRMSQHLREQHGPVSIYSLDKCTKTVLLQTFFRGNKISYFEVRSDNESELTARQHSGRFSREDPRDYIDVLIPLEQSQASANATPQLGISDLLYLHHYTICAGLSMTRGTEPAELWTHDLPLQAAEHPFLMRGMLGVAAYHQACISSQPDVRLEHQAAALHHQSAGLATFRQMIDSDGSKVSTATIAFARLLGVQCCAQTLLENKRGSRSQNHDDLSTVIELLSLLRGGLCLFLSLQARILNDSPLKLSTKVMHGLDKLEVSPEGLDPCRTTFVNEVFHRLSFPPDTSSTMFALNDGEDVRQLIQVCSLAFENSDPGNITTEWVANKVASSVTLTENAHRVATIFRDPNVNASIPPIPHSAQAKSQPCPVLACYPHIPPAIYGQLQTIPVLLAANAPAIDESSQRAFDQAMAALVSCFSRSYVEDTLWARWNGIESWANMLPPQFFDMMKAACPWALALVVCWSFLLGRQEPYYWFLQGQWERVLEVTFSKMDSKIRGLLQRNLHTLL